MDSIFNEDDNLGEVSEEIGQSQLSYEIITNEDEFDDLEEEWNHLVKNTETSIFQTFDWQRTWWKYYGQSNGKLNIVLFRNAEELVGILPVFIDTYRVFSKSVYSCLRFIGSNIMQPRNKEMIGLIAYTDYLDIIVQEEYELPVLNALREYLYSYRKKFDLIRLDEVPEDSVLHKVTELFSRGDRPFWEILQQNASACPVVQFPETWNQLLNNLSSNARYQIRRDVKKVQHRKKKLFDLKVIKSENELSAAYHTLTEYHQERWNRLGFPGAFKESSKYNFLKEVINRFNKKGWLKFYALTPCGESDEYVAMDLLFQYQDRIYLVERAFDADSPWSEEGPGNVLLYTVMKKAIEDGKQIYDFLRGKDSYKLRTANHLKQNKLIKLKPADSPKMDMQILFRLLQNWVKINRRLRYEAEMFKAQLQYHSHLSAFIQFANHLKTRITRKI